MVEIKEMSYREKFEEVLNGMKFVEGYVMPFVKEKLGNEEIKSLRGIWEEESERIPEGASDQEKYEIAYRNWLRNWESAYRLVRDNLGEAGIEEFKQAAVEANVRKNAGFSLSLLNFVRSISPQTAFKTFSKTMAYKLQVFSPLSVPELTGQHMVLEIPHCKVLDVQGCDEFCTVACQKIYPTWLEKQFKIKMATDISGKNCTVNLCPL